jgi:hypothetical protein
MQIVNNIFNNQFINRNIIWKSIENTFQLGIIKSFEDTEYSYIIKVEDLDGLNRYDNYASYFKKHSDSLYEECDFIISYSLYTCESLTERNYMFLKLNHKRRYSYKKRIIKYFSLKYASNK